MSPKPPVPSTPSATSPATTGPTDAEWSGARGEKWRAQLSGMEGTLAPVDGPLIDALHLDAPLRIADVGCGGGGTSLEILRRAPTGSIVHGFDISPALIEVARHRARSDERAIAFEMADMAKAPPPPQLYERLVSRFGIMFFDDPSAAFASLARWLAPRGRFAFAAWARPADNPWVTIVRDVTAEIVDVPSPDPEAPGQFRYADVDKLVALLEGAGFGDVEVRAFRGSLPVGGGLPAAEAANFALAAFSSFGELLAGAGDRARDDAHRRLTERFAQYENDGVVRIAASVHIVTGARLDHASELRA